MKIRSILCLGLVVPTMLAAACSKEMVTPKEANAGGSRSSAGSSPASQPANPDEGVTVGKVVPPYQAEWLDGRAFRLADARGKVVLLNIWATWCGPCRYEIPELKILQSSHEANGFEVIGISIDDSDARDQVKEFVQKSQINYPIAFDPTGGIADLFETTVIPTSALIGRDGRVLWYHRGLVTTDDPTLQEALRKAL